MIKKPIYPAVNISSHVDDSGIITTYGSRALTYLRKKHNGKWYLILHINQSYSNLSLEHAKFTTLRELTENIYMSINFYKVDPEARNSYGELMDTLDEFQGSELERFKHLHKRNE